MVPVNKKVSDIDLLKVIYGYVVAFGWAPSVQDIIDKTSISSKATVVRRFNELEEYGYLERLHGQPRALRLTVKGREMVTGKL